MSIARADRGPVLLVLCASVVIVNLDNTILNVALPTLVDKLHATSSQLQWIVDSYAMVFAGLVLVCGSLADRFGRKRCFLMGVSVFATGSTGAAFSGSVDLLIAWRVVMGIGAALMMPSTLSIINDVFRDPVARAKAIGAWAATAGLGIALGPIAGGILLSRFWWGSVFLVNVPVACAAFFWGLRLLPESRNPAPTPPDPCGAVLSVAGLGMVLWSIIEGPSHGWGSATVVWPAVAGLAVLSSFLAWEAHSPNPMLQLKLFGERRFSVAAAGLCLGVFGLMGALFVQTQFLQFDLGYSPLQAGLRILPIAGMLVLSGVIAPRVAGIIGIKLTAATGLTTVAAGLWQISAASSSTVSYADVVPGLLLLGLGAGTLIPTATNSIVGSVPQGDSGVGSASNVVAFQLGGALGVAVVGSVLSTRYQNHLDAALAGRHLPATATQAILGSLGGALQVSAGVGAGAGALLARAARAAFLSGMGSSLAVAASVALFGALVVLARLPSHGHADSTEPLNDAHPNAHTPRAHADRDPLTVSGVSPT